MRNISSSFSLAYISSALGLDVVELWSFSNVFEDGMMKSSIDTDNNKLCKEFIQQHNIIEIEDNTFQLKENILWKHSNIALQSTDQSLEIKTKLVFKFNPSYNDDIINTDNISTDNKIEMELYLVGLSTKSIPFKNAYESFLINITNAMKLELFEINSYVDDTSISHYSNENDTEKSLDTLNNSKHDNTTSTHYDLDDVTHIGNNKTSHKNNRNRASFELDTKIFKPTGLRSIIKMNSTTKLLNKSSDTRDKDNNNNNNNNNNSPNVIAKSHSSDYYIESNKNINYENNNSSNNYKLDDNNNNANNNDDTSSGVWLKTYSHGNTISANDLLVVTSDVAYVLPSDSQKLRSIARFQLKTNSKSTPNLLKNSHSSSFILSQKNNIITSTSATTITNDFEDHLINHNYNDSMSQNNLLNNHISSHSHDFNSQEIILTVNKFTDLFVGKVGSHDIDNSYNNNNNNIYENNLTLETKINLSNEFDDMKHIQTDDSQSVIYVKTLSNLENTTTQNNKDSSNYDTTSNNNNDNNNEDVVMITLDSSSHLKDGFISLPPTWLPTYDKFSYSIGQISIKSNVSDNLNFDLDFTNIIHIADGSNANIFSAIMNNNQIKVIIKMIKIEKIKSSVAIHEFDLEHGMLTRLSHPNIIQIYGAGRTPRRFIVLEYLEGGVLEQILMKNVVTSTVRVNLFHKPTFKMVTLLQRAKELAEAMIYLHYECQEGAMLLHRDIKPDNVGFSHDGKVKLFDFGLSTCIKSTPNNSPECDSVYKMTGCTGSLRYMAPEVALEQPYNEKADVYSFGILLWQMASDKIPFHKFTKNLFYSQIVHNNMRPKIDKHWPIDFINLLESCWHYDYLKRPDFHSVIKTLDLLIKNEHNRTFRTWSFGRGSKIVSYDN
eukprot:gene15147-20400_t